MGEIRTPYADNFDLTSDAARASAVRWQLFTRIIVTPIIWLCSRGIKVMFSHIDLNPENRYVLAANHQSTLDSFLMLSAIPWKCSRRLKPIRAMLNNRYLNGGPLSSYLLGMGCFPAKEHSKYGYGLEISSRFLELGQTVFICPEGKLTLQGATPPHRGVTVLAKEPNVLIIPTHIHWTRYGRWCRTFKLTYGMPFDGSKMTAQEILDTIYALPLG